jgi:predicted metal-dependent phosphoesterase TrpH
MQKLELFKDRTKYEARLKELASKGYFLADIHVHTTRSDGTASPHKVIALAAEKGFFVAISDHNLVMDFKALTCEERNRVIPAIEIKSKEGIDVLAYFYKAEELEKFYNSRIKPRKISPYYTSIPLVELLIVLSKERCVINIPHSNYPRAEGRINFTKMYPGLRKNILAKIDTFEAFNSSEDKKQNAEAARFAKEMGKAMAVGSDAHTLKATGNAINYCKAKDCAEFLDNLANKKTGMIAIKTPYIHAKLMSSGKVALMKIKGVLGLKN